MALTQSVEQGPCYPVVCGTVMRSAVAAVTGSTVIITNAPPGLYRFSACLLVTTGGTSGTLLTNVINTDDQGAQTTTVATIAALQTPGQSNGVAVFNNTATANISYSVSTAGTFGACVYNVYIVVERIL